MGVQFYIIKIPAKSRTLIYKYNFLESWKIDKKPIFIWSLRNKLKSKLLVYSIGLLNIDLFNK